MRGVFLFLTLAILLWVLGSYMLPQHAEEEVSTTAVEVKGIFVAPGSFSPVIVLREVEGNRSIPIWIGMTEAEAIGRRLSGEDVPRPLTHELLTDAVRKMGGDVKRIVVTDLREGTYYARIDLMADGDSVSLDARPSDAIALALGFSAPIYVAESVMAVASEEDLVVQDPASTLSDPDDAGCGIWCQPLGEEMSDVLGIAAGVLVADLSPEQEADGSLLRGDVIVDVGGQPIDAPERLRELLSGLDAEVSISMNVLREGETVTVEFTCH